MRDRRREQWQRRVPSQLLREHEIGEPQRKDFRIDRRRVVQQAQRPCADARRRDKRRVTSCLLRKRDQRLAIHVRWQVEMIRSDAPQTRIEPQATGCEQPPQAMQARAGCWRSVNACKMLRVP